MHKILLVEDDEVIRQQVKKILEQWEYEVVLVEDFMEVLSLFVKEEPPLGSYGYWFTSIQRLSLVSGNSEGLQGAYYVLVFQRSGHGYRYGNQYGWGRLCD